MSSISGAYGSHFQHTYLAPVAAADATIEVPIFHFKSADNDTILTRLLSVKIIPRTAVTGADTDTKHINVINKLATGVGTAELATLELTSGVDLAIMKSNVVYTSVADEGQGDLMVSDNVLSLQVEKVGNGIALPSMMVEVEYTMGGIA